jgi:hypothetical protein
MRVKSVTGDYIPNSSLLWLLWGLRPLLLGSNGLPSSCYSLCAVASLPRGRPVAVAERIRAVISFSAAINSIYRFHSSALNILRQKLIFSKPVGSLPVTCALAL